MNYWKHESRLRLTCRSAAYSSNQLTRWFIGSEVRRELSWRLPSELKWASGVVSYRPQNFRWGGRVWETLLIRHQFHGRRARGRLKMALENASAT
jgi:hypothetical protein